jgi:PhnB protein
VPDSEETQRRAVEAGATEVTRQTVLFFGDRVGRVRDPFGNLWWIQTRLENLDEAEMARRAQLSEYLEAMAYVQGADLVNGRP